MRRIGTSGLQFTLAMLLSLALWTFVSFTTNPTERDTLTLPVTVTEPSDDLIVVNEATRTATNAVRTVRVEISGPEQDLLNIDDEDLSAVVNLTNYPAGVHEVPIEVTRPDGIRVRSIAPPTLQIELAPRVTRNLPVEVVISGRPPFLFEQRNPTLAVRRATATGPQQLMERVAEVVVPLDLQGRTASFTEEFALQAVDRDGNPVPNITLDPATTLVTVPIATRIDVQRVPVVPRLEGLQAPGYTIENFDWNPKYVEIISPLEITGTLSTEPIDLTNRTEPFTQTVRVENPDPDTTQILSDTITVTVPIEPLQLPARVDWFVAVAPVNVDAGLQAALNPAGVTITISGAADQLRQLVNTAPQATVDLSELDAGSYTLPVEITLPPGLQLVGSPPEISVILTPVASPSAGGG
jgi:YbbR domain-containing protein